MGSSPDWAFRSLYDSRDNILNPRRGAYLEFGNQFFGKYLGSDYTFNNYRFDLRKYFNPCKESYLSRSGGYGNLRYTKNEHGIPLRALSRVGGFDFIRGYFRGTFQDRHMLAFETEYRLPLWADDSTETLWKFWKRLGLVAFVSGAQVYGDKSNFSMDAFNLAVGGGIRILFNRQSRVNIRIDYALGLAADSAGPGKRQNGLYFYLSEAFWCSMLATT